MLATLAHEDEAVGRAFPVSVTVVATPANGLQLVFNENHSAGSGRTWRASELSAAVQAIFATSVPPNGLKIQYDVEGDIDGPSAGALITVGLMAAIQGDPILRGISMTGTINPDGSIGAVSSVPAKVRGAGQEGLHTVLIPTGLRHGLDGVGPDVVEIGRSVGVRVVEVGDVYEAYELMTGVAFASAGAGNASAPLLGPTFVAMLDQRTAEWTERYTRNRGVVATIDRALLERYGSLELAEEADRNAAESKRLRAANRYAAAYDASVASARLAALARYLPEALTRYEASGVASVQAWLDERGHVERGLVETLAEIQQVAPVTFNDFAALSIAYAGLIEGFSLERGAAAVFAHAAGDRHSPRAEVEAAVVEAVTREIEAAAFMLAATDYLAFRTALAADGRAVATDLDVVSDTLKKAADANLLLFDAITLETIARENDLPIEVVRERFALRSKTYREFIAVEKFRSRIGPHIRDERHRALAGIGLDLWRYVTAAELLATHYSLAVRVDPDTLQVDQFAVTPPLRAMFESSDKQIRRSIDALLEAQIDPQLVLATHQIGQEGGRSAVVSGDGTRLMRSLRHVWATRVITEAFLLGFDPTD